MARFVCPNCGHQNYRKIMSIISEGVTSTQVPHTVPLQWGGKTYYFQTSQDVTTTSGLAERLRPPKKLTEIKPPNLDPMKFVTPRGKGGLYYLTYMGVWYTVISAFPAAFFLLLVFIAAMPSAFVYWPKFIPILIVVFGNFGIALAVTTFLYYIVKKENAEDIQKGINKAKAQHQRDLQAIDRYFRLYYCYVCDNVFDAEDRKKGFAAPEHILLYLYH